MTVNAFDNLLWTCAHCERWWLSQRVSSSSWRLVKLAAFSQLPLELGHAPAWLVSGPDPSVCPECGTTMVVQENGRLQPDMLQIIRS